MKSLIASITESIEKFTPNERKIISMACRYTIRQSEYDNPDSYTFEKYIKESDFGNNILKIATIDNVKDLVSKKENLQLESKEIVLAFLLINYIRSTDDSTYGFDDFVERQPNGMDKICSMGNVSKLKTKLTEMINEDEKLSDLLGW